MSVVSALVLNHDCWNAIFVFFKNDFRTLSRIMRVSKYFFTITAPVLYGQLGQSANKEQVERWSVNKHHKLSVLLLTSSGFLGPTCREKETTVSTTDVSSGSDVSRKDEGVCLDDNQGYYCQKLQILHSDKYPGLRLFRFNTALSVDYFGLMKRLPRHLLGIEIWNRIMEDMQHSARSKRDGQHSAESTARIATVLTEVSIGRLEEIRKWLPLVEKFKNLEVLFLEFLDPYPTNAREMLYEFVIRHVAAFPGQLKEIRVGRSQEANIGMGLSKLLASPEKLRLCLYDGIDKEFQIYGDNINESNTSYAPKKFFGSVKQLEFKERESVSYTIQNPQPSSNFLIQVMKHCRQLESAKIETCGDRRTSTLSSAGLFAWAPQELFHQTAVSTSKALKDQEQSRLPTSAIRTDEATTPLVPLKFFSGHHLYGSVMMDVLDGFRYSLERLEFHSSAHMQLVSLDWNWVMPRLKVLKLYYCFIQHCKLEKYCPQLEELYFEKVPSAETYPDLFRENGIRQRRLRNDYRAYNDHLERELTTQPWSALRTLRVFHLTRTPSSTKLDLASIGELKDLEDLCLGSKEKLDADEFNILGRLHPIRLLHWDLRNLKRLTLTETPEPNWQRLLLYSAPCLEYFATPGKEFPPLSAAGFWRETKLQTLNRIAEFEREVNKFRMDREELWQKLEEELRIINLCSTSQTLQDVEIWNAHSTRLCSLEFGGFWQAQNVESLKVMLTSGWEIMAPMNSDHQKERKKHNKSNQPEDLSLFSGVMKKLSKFRSPTGSHSSPLSGTKTYQVPDRVCFPCLRHLKLNNRIVDGSQGEMDGLVKVTMQRPGMARVEIQGPILSSDFVENCLQEIDADSVPVNWEDDFGGGTSGLDEGECLDHFCKLSIQLGNQDPKYFRLKQ